MANSKRQKHGVVVNRITECPSILECKIANVFGPEEPDAGTETHPGNDTDITYRLIFELTFNEKNNLPYCIGPPVQQV